VKKARGATWREEPLSRGDASHSGWTKGRPDEITAALTWSLVTRERASLLERILDEGETNRRGRRRRLSGAR